MSVSNMIDVAKNLFGTAMNSPLLAGNSTSILTGTALTVGLFSFTKIYQGITKSINSRIEGDELKLERDAKVERYISEVEGKLTKERIIEIVSLDASTLLKKIRAKEITVIEAYIAYSYRAATIGKEYGWITDVDFDNGLIKAQEYQKLIDSNNTEELDKYPLLGLPMSIKDHIAMKDLVSTVGFSSLSKNVCQEDSFIVNVMRRKGAIPFVHSNVPQGCMAIDSSNYLWGRCDNAWNRSKIAGGSSGGEGGLIASRCSAVGIGSDIGGSIRIPSVLNGLYGFKPTSSRVSDLGSYNFTGTTHCGFHSINVSYGPMCKSAEDVILMAKNLFGEFEDDYHVNNKSFDNEVFNAKTNPAKIKIGYYYDTAITDCTPSIDNAVIEVAELLTKLGYEVVRFPYDKFNKLVELGFALLINSGASEIIPQTMKGEAPYYYYQKMLFLWNQPQWVVSVSSYLAFFLGEKRASHFIQNFKKMDRIQFIEASRKFQELKLEFVNYWRKEGFSALISPVLPLTSISHGNSDHFVNFNQFNFLSNMMDMPACTIPLRLNEDVSFSSRYKDKFAQMFELEAKDSRGMPIGIQVIGFPMQDELVLRLMKDISANYDFENKLGNKIFEVLDVEAAKPKIPVTDMMTSLKEMFFSKKA